MEVKGILSADKLIANGMIMPFVDGLNGYVVTTDGNGNLTLQPPNSSTDTLLFSNDGTLTGMTTTNDTTNVWISTTVDSIEGANSLCISDNGVNSQYNVNVTNTSHIETDSFAISANAESAYVKLTSWEGVGEAADGVNNYDFARVFIAYDTFTPVAGTLPVSGANIDYIGILKLQNSSEVREAYMFLDSAELTKYKGSNCKVIVSWTNDANTGTSPAITIGGLEVYEGESKDISKTHVEVYLDFANITVSSGLDTKIGYNFIIDDRSRNWDFTNDKFVATEDGLHLICASENLQLNAAGLGSIRLFKNGSSYNLEESDRTSISSSVYPSFSICIDLKIGDEIEIYAYQNSGFNASLISDNKCKLTITKIKD
jgi:hypothetical protein